MPENFPSHTPSPEEIKKAEEMMTEEEREASEKREKGVRPVDVRTLFQVKVNKDENKFFRTEEEDAMIPIAGSKFETRFPVAGKIETTAEEKERLEKINQEEGPDKGKRVQLGLDATFKIDYAQLPDGTIKGARLEENFSDGSKEVLEREFSESGQELFERDTLNGKLVKERRFAYREDGSLNLIVTIEYDAAGKEKWREEIKRAPGAEEGVLITSKTTENGKESQRQESYKGSVARQRTAQKFSCSKAVIRDGNGDPMRPLVLK